jgi:hypothetical protein
MAIVVVKRVLASMKPIKMISGRYIDSIWNNLDKCFLTAWIIHDINSLHFRYLNTPTKQALPHETIYD